jgi:hypothetical protein
LGLKSQFFIGAGAVAIVHYGSTAPQVMKRGDGDPQSLLEDQPRVFFAHTGRMMTLTASLS